MARPRAVVFGMVDVGSVRGLSSHRLLLIHSPLVGPSTMARLASSATAAGHQVATTDLTGVAEAPSPRWRWFVERAAAAAQGWSPPVVVAHSGAGPMLPAIAGRLEQGPAALVFADAVVPPESGHHRHSAEMAPMLDRQTTGGRLARWLDWWPDDVVESLLPEPADRVALAADMPRLPRDFYDEPIPMPAGWSQQRCAYLQLSPAYDLDRRRAEQRGWPTIAIDSSHLGLHTDPGPVLEKIGALLDRLAPSSG
ncbi:MAG: hypothetical protein ACR2QK_21415 [Acidimicrobiales bacterium]